MRTNTLFFVCWWHWQRRYVKEGTNTTYNSTFSEWCLSDKRYYQINL